MRIVFVHRMVYQDPLGIMYLAASLRRAGHEVHFVDVAVEAGWEDRVVGLGPDVVGYSVITGNHGAFLEANRRLKRRCRFLSLWGGPHPTFFPEFIHEGGVDAICVGEGEEAIVDLADAIDRGADITGIPNLHVKLGGRVIRNEPRPLCQDLDALPHPDRSILTRYPQYRCVSSRAVVTSRGCPHRCAFCYNTRYRDLYRGKGRYSRHRSVDSVIEECARHRADPWARQILFRDDLFARDARFVRAFADRYPREVGLPFACNVRADRMTEQIADDLARAGAKVAQFGVESGSDRVRRDILRRPISREELLRTARWLRARGIKIYTYNILGIPGESPEEALETLALNAEIGADMAMFSLFQPYPRTPLGDRAVELGWIDEGYQDFSASFYSSSMKRMPQGRRYRNMVHLFPAAARFAPIARLAPLLSRLPLTPLYSGFDFVFKATRFVFTLGFVRPLDILAYSGHWDPQDPR
jgi:radical SAM superfamily enzyme YgiQ (UPF0313 family)